MIFIGDVFVWKYPCLGKLFKKIKTICSGWISGPRLIWICRIEWWFSFFFFLDWKYFFVSVWSKNWKLSVLAEIWYLGYFEYVKIDDDIHLFCFRQFFANFFNKAFGILLLLHQSPSSLLTETWSQWVSCFN